MVRFVAIAADFLCSCSTRPSHLDSNQNAVVRGVAGNATCATSAPYSGTFAVIELTQTVSFGSISVARRIELIMPERYHVQRCRVGFQPTASALPDHVAYRRRPSRLLILTQAPRTCRYSPSPPSTLKGHSQRSCLRQMSNSRLRTFWIGFTHHFALIALGRRRPI